MSTRGMVATSQPLAAWAGTRVLERGGNAVDAAVAAAALLGVLEPMSTGVGGDMFALVYDAKTEVVQAVNGSGRAPGAASLEEYRQRLDALRASDIPAHSPLAWTVPGAVDGWATLLEKWGRMGLAEVLEPAIRAAEEGFAVAPQTAEVWQQSLLLLRANAESAGTWLTEGGSAPRAGKVFRNPRLGETLRQIAEGGREAFYRGPLAHTMVNFSEQAGGLLSLSDFARHRSEVQQPLAADYRGYQVLECPPNSQGVAALEALLILEEKGLRKLGPGHPDAVHFQIEALKLALEDARSRVTDPHLGSSAADALVDPGFIRDRRELISAERALGRAERANVVGDTVYVAVADQQGNVVSLSNSLFMPWGSGWTVGESGILLQNRGQMFSVDPESANVIAPGKRTRHTLAPALLCAKGRPQMAFGFVGGDMQVQAHIQFLCNVLDFGMDLQEALDSPRWRYDGPGTEVALEAEVSRSLRRELARRGHILTGASGFFGGGQAVWVDLEAGSLQGASDLRRDGCAIGF